jgi:hypothetical protein
VKRPWYLFAALIAGWIYGAQALGNGYETVLWYRGDRPDFTAEADAATDPHAREVILAATEQYVAKMDAARQRQFPIAIASILLGGAMILFAARSMAGREGARSALVQVVGVHAAVVVAGFLLTSQVTRARFELDQRIGEERVRRSFGITQPPEADAMGKALVRVWPGFEVFLRTLASGLIIVALTRPRSRAFFEAATSQLGEG